MTVSTDVSPAHAIIGPPPCSRHSAMISTQSVSVSMDVGWDIWEIAMTWAPRQERMAKTNDRLQGLKHQRPDRPSTETRLPPIKAPREAAESS